MYKTWPCFFGLVDITQEAPSGRGLLSNDLLHGVQGEEVHRHLHRAIEDPVLLLNRIGLQTRADIPSPASPTHRRPRKFRANRELLPTLEGYLSTGVLALSNERIHQSCAAKWGPKILQRERKGKPKLVKAPFRQLLGVCSYQSKL